MTGIDHCPVCAAWPAPAWSWAGGAWCSTSEKFHCPVTPAPWPYEGIASGAAGATCSACSAGSGQCTSPVPAPVGATCAPVTSGGSTHTPVAAGSVAAGPPGAMVICGGT